MYASPGNCENFEEGFGLLGMKIGKNGISVEPEKVRVLQ